MFVAKVYDLGVSKEATGYYPSELKNNINKDFVNIGGNANKIEYFQTEEFKKKDNIDRAVRRAKTKIRRTAEKYNLRYMWTMTFAKQITKIRNPKNKKEYTYDCSTWEGAWKLFNIFIDRCRRAGFTFNYIVTAEIQEKREEKYGERVYHFHMATDKWLPQNDTMRKKYNYSHSFKERFDYSFNDFWTFGHTKATIGKSDRRKCYNYLIKYISKAFELIDVKGKQRYHISNGMEVTFEYVKFDNHMEFLLWCEMEQKVQKNSFGRPMSKYFVLGDTLEMWWVKFV